MDVLVVDKSYTKIKHDAMLTSAGVSDTTKTRKELLLAWKQQESNNHWGLGFPRTPFRMTEGSGDEFGSLSFSQVLFHFRYGKATCKAHRESGLNMFDPGDNMKMFALHLSAKSNCPGEFYKVYGKANANRSLSGLTELKGYLRNGVFVEKGTTEDEYEVLARAIGGYNGGSFYGSLSWPELIKEKNYTEISEQNNDGLKCSSCTYTIDVRNKQFGLPYRAYVWKGEDVWNDINKNNVKDDGEITEWCFGYGEKEWVGAKKHPITKKVLGFIGYKDLAKVDINKRVSCE